MDDRTRVASSWYRGLKVVHLLGMVLFLGGIAAAIVLAAAKHLGALEGYRVRRGMAAELTWDLIVPGLWLTVLAGAAMTWRGRWGLFTPSWLGAKQALGVLMVLNGTLALVPLVSRIGALLAGASPDLAEAARLQGLEDRLGGVNLLSALACLLLAVWRPGQARRRLGPVADGPRA
jgi:hypothetical protein